jgi:hypothetical protein
VSIEDLTPQYNEAEKRLKETKDWVEGVVELTRVSRESRGYACLVSYGS